LRPLFDGLMQATVHATPPPSGLDIDALDPPKLGIPPIAPFIRDETLSDHGTARMLGHVERSAIGPLEDSQRALPQSVGVQGPLLRFPSHGCAEARQRLDILRAARPYRNVFNGHRPSG
jgi:hypothetical protein